MRHIAMPMFTVLILGGCQAAFGQQVAAVPRQDGKTYELRSDGKLWLGVLKTPTYCE